MTSGNPPLPLCSATCPPHAPAFSANGVLVDTEGSTGQHVRAAKFEITCGKVGSTEEVPRPLSLWFPCLSRIGKIHPHCAVIIFFSFPLLQAWSGFSGQEPLYTSLLSAPNMYVLVPTGRDGRCDLEKAGTKQPTPRFPFAEVPSCLQEPLRPLWKSLRGFTRCFLPRAGRAALSRGSSCRDSGSGYLRLIHPPSVLICYVAVISASTMKMPLCLLPRNL